MAIEIFWGSGSPFSWRVLLGAELKGLAYESRMLEFSKGQLKTPEFLKMNPRGKVPVIRDGEFVLFESLAILEYFEDKSREVPLFGRSQNERALIRRLIAEFESYLREPIFKLTVDLFRTASTQSRDQAGPPNSLDESLKIVLRELGALEERLTGGAWLAAERASAADIAIYPFIALLQRATMKAETAARALGLHPLEEVFPNVQRWTGLIETIPGYERTYPPHWRPAP